MAHAGGGKAKLRSLDLDDFFSENSNYLRLSDHRGLAKMLVTMEQVAWLGRFDVS